ncbi:MAG: DUF1795 domain-containing protein [Microscillaceae bacterium]|nr:DUF1795 domain-containing protein [Microscillaceae bacterium]
MQKYTLSSMGISFEIPEDWKIRENPDFPLILFAPEEKDYQANINFRWHRQSVLNPDEFEALATQAHHQLSQLAHYEEKQKQKIFLSNLPAYLLSFSWKMDESPFVRFSQLHILTATGPQNVLEINAATLYDLAPKHFPVFKSFCNP